MRVLLLSSLLPAFTFAAPLEGVPPTGATAAAFAPAGFEVESSLEGELNLDGVRDLVVVLVESAAKRDGDRSRALLWLHGVPAGGYALVASNVGLLACVGCLGINGGDAAPELTLSPKGVLAVSQSGGSRERYGTTHRFRLEQQGVTLIGLDTDEHDGLSGAGRSLSTNLLTGAQVAETTDAKGRTSKVKKKVKPAPVPFAEVRGYGAS